MFNFISKLEEGASARKQALECRKEISQVYTEFCHSIGEFIGESVDIYERNEYEDDTRSFLSNTIGGASAFGARSKPTGYKLISIATKEKKKKTGTLFKTREPDEGYPVHILFEDNEYACFSQQELIGALEDIATNVSFHNALEALK